MGTLRRQYTDEFKPEAVGLLASSGRPLSQIAQELGIASSRLRAWRNRDKGVRAGSPRRPNTQAAIPPAGADLAAENARLRRENERLHMEREILRVGPKSSLTQTKLSEHETNRGEAEKSECVSGEIFEILGQAATAIDPREGALDNPASRQKLKPFGVIGAFDDFDFEVRQKFGRSLLKDWPLISAVPAKSFCKNGY